MGFGRDPFAGWEESARIHSDLRMCTDFINLIESAEKRERERTKALKSIIDKWLENIGNKLITILEQIKTHLHTWVSVKVNSIDDELSLYINDYFDSKIKPFEEGVWFDNSEEHNTVINNIKEAEKITSFNEEDIRFAMTKWLNTITDRIVVLLEICKEDIYKRVTTKISIRESNYVDEFFCLGVRKFKGIEESN